MHTNKQLFFSHTWKYDEQNRNTHQRVKNICELMQHLGWSIWLDEDNMTGNIDSVMVNGIRNCQVVIICLTAAYIKKVNRASEDGVTRDNCYKEWTFSNSMQKRMLPIILEPAVTSMIDKGVIDLFLGNTFYIDLSDINNQNIKALNEALSRYNIKPDGPVARPSLKEPIPKLPLKPINLLKNKQETISKPTLLPPINQQEEKNPNPPPTPRYIYKSSNPKINNEIFNCILINSLRKKLTQRKY